MESQKIVTSGKNQEDVLQVNDNANGSTETKISCEVNKTDPKIRHIDGYEVKKSFDQNKDKDGLFVGIVKKDGEESVMKAMDSSKTKMFEKEAANNECLSNDSPFTLKMTLCKPAQPDMGILELADKNTYKSYSYMILPFHKNGCLLDLLNSSLNQKEASPFISSEEVLPSDCPVY